MDRSPPSSSAKPASYVLRHWRGELSLAKAFWVNGALVTGLCVLLFIPLWMLMLRFPPAPLTALLILAVMLLVTSALCVWQLVGSWRSARANARPARKRIWTILTRLCIVASVLHSGYIIHNDLYPALKAGVKLAMASNPLPARRITLLAPDQLELAGGIGSGSLSDFEQALRDHPQVRTVHLDSGGGSMLEGLAIARVIENRGLDTYTNADCMSACTLLFSAGKQRWLGPQGRLGYHAASLYGSGERLEPLIDPYRAFFKDHGISTAFIDQVMATPPAQLWFPDRKRLEREGIVTALADPERFADARLLRLHDPAQFDRYMRGIAYYHALAEVSDERYQDELHGAATMRDALRSFSEFDRLNRQRASALLHGAMRRAAAEAQLPFWQTQLQVLETLHLQDPRDCASYISGRPRADGRGLTLPGPLQEQALQRQSALVRAGLESRDNPQPGPQAKTDLEGVWNALEARWPQAWAYYRQPARHLDRGDALCLMHIELYRSLLALPDRQRAGDALRQLPAYQR